MYTAEDINSDKDLVERYAPLVKKIAHHLLGRLPPNVLLDDLVQSGMIGLLEAAKNYSQNKGASFETYAGIRIRGSMLDEIRKGDWAPRSVHRNTRKITQAIREIENRTGRDAKDYEVAESLEMDLDDYHQMVQDINSSRVFVFGDIGYNDDATTDSFKSSLPGPLDKLQYEAFRQKLAVSISDLPEREQMVIALYYDEDLNLREVGEVLGVSESRISQIHSQAMLRLQSRMSDWRQQVN